MIQFLKDVDFSATKPVLEKVLQTPDSVEVKIVLPKGVELKKHRVISRIIIQVLQGDINFTRDGEDIRMQAGDLIKVENNIYHSLKANENSVMRLTMFELH